MKFDFKKILTTILSIALAILGGSQYHQMSALNELQSTVKTLADEGKLLAKTVDSVAHRDFTRFESE